MAVHRINSEGLFAQWCRRNNHAVPTEIDLANVSLDDGVLLSGYMHEVALPIVLDELRRRLT